MEITAETQMINGSSAELHVSSNDSSEPSLDTVPLELTVTTSISPLTPTSSSAPTSCASSSTIGAVQSSDDCSTLDVGAMIETSTISPISEPTTIMSPKSEMENESKMQLSGQYHRSLSRSVQTLSPVSVIVKSDTEIKAGSRFISFADFERVFEHWKATNFHPFRVASSETLRLPDGSTNTIFKYRYIVYHCAHYGAPRMRGVGKRPNQNYMPCGCKAMLRLNYSWSENALRVTTLNEDHIGHDATEDAYYKFAAKVKQRQSSSSPPAVNGPALPGASQILSAKRPRSESPYSSNIVNQSYHPPTKIARTTQVETPLNLSKSNCEIVQNHVMMTTGSMASSLPPLSTTLAPTAAQTPALSVLMFNHQQQQRQQDAYRELLRLISVNGNNGTGLVTAIGANGIRDAQTESGRHRLIIPMMQAMTHHLASARGYDFDEKFRDLKALLKKWNLIPQPSIPPPTAPPTIMPNTFGTRPSSATAAAAAMMVQAMSASAGGSAFTMTNGDRNGATIGGNGLISNGH